MLTSRIIEEHMERHRGPSDTVFHELPSGELAIDVHVIAPTSAQPFWTLFTTGMSSRPMRVPEGFDEYRHAELLLSLPASWKPGHASPSEESWHWPLAWLKHLARFPHVHDTWLGHGHTIPNGDPAEALAPETEACAWLVLPSLLLPRDAWTLELPEDRTVHFYALHALYLAELNFKLARGTDALLDLFEQNDVREVLDAHRPSVIRKEFLGIF